MTAAGADRIAEVFVELADTLVADFDLIAFLHRLTDACVEVLDVQAAGLMLADQNGQLRSAAATGNVGPLERFEIEHGHGPCLECFNSGEPVVNVTPEDAQRRWPAFTAFAANAGFAAVHALPLRLRGQVIGGINLYCSKRLAMSQIQLNVAQALADVATIGLLQERTIHDKTILTEQLQTALNTRVIIEQAKGAIAERRGITPTEAFGLMRTHARRYGLHLAQLAADVLNGTVDPTSTSQPVSTNHVSRLER